jgi:hypothetical protein
MRSRNRSRRSSIRSWTDDSSAMRSASNKGAGALVCLKKGPCMRMKFTVDFCKRGPGFIVTMPPLGYGPTRQFSRFPTPQGAEEWISSRQRKLEELAAHMPRRHSAEPTGAIRWSQGRRA